VSETPTPQANPIPQRPARTGALVRYNLARLGMLVVVGALAYLAGLRGPLLAVGALLVSGVLSYFLLFRQREALARVLVDSVGSRRPRPGGGNRFARRHRIAELTAREDAAAEAWHARTGGAPSGQQPAERLPGA
jgi:hypothetical protein